MKFNLSKIKHVVILLSLSLCVSAFSQSTYKLADDMSADQFDFSFKIRQINQTTKNLSMKIEQKDSGNYLDLSIGQNDIVLTRVLNSKKLQIVKIPVTTNWKTAEELLIARRSTWIGIQINNILLWDGTVERIGGDEGMMPRNSNWEVTDVKMQRTEPVVFNDDFMRTSNEIEQSFKT